VAGVYVPRSPTSGVLYGVVRMHLADFLAAVDARTDGSGLPPFVTAEFRKFLRCGVLAHEQEGIFAPPQLGVRRDRREAVGEHLAIPGDEIPVAGGVVELFSRREVPGHDGRTIARPSLRAG